MTSGQIQLAFGTVLRRLREERGMTQEDLAHESGVGRVSIAMMETGKRLPTLPTIFRLADALGEKPEDIVRLLRAEAR